MAKTLLTCLLLLGICTSGTQGNAKCINALYQGGRAAISIVEEIERVGYERRDEIYEQSGHRFYKLTCGKAEMVLSTVVSEFNEEGCSWGMDNRVFESKVLSLIEPLVKGCTCPMFEGVSLTCSSTSLMLLLHINCLTLFR